MGVQQSLGQSADPDGLHVVVNAAGGATWRICSRGTCIEDRCGARLMARYRDLLISQGRPAPIS
jgi:hypothetical protein